MWFMAVLVVLGATQEVEFARDVKPLLERHCVDCHGEGKSKADLRLDLRERAFAGSYGGTEKVIVPGNAAASSLYTRLLAEDADERMPHKAAPLSADEVATIRLWIDGGAAWPDEVAGVDGRAAHWAYQRPLRSAVPEVAHKERVRNPIDAFLEARFEREGKTPALEASRATLARRLHLDLTGIPPTLEEVGAFENDQRTDAYERFVRKLLASPRYGERMARPWLDLARYADTQGYEKDARRSMAPYRDWVIAALNGNLPYDQFSIEQLAGDLLPNATRSQRIATAFHRNTMLNEEGGTDAEEFRSAAVIDRVNTTATIWMGSTLACAQCHDHKYDPFSQADYYRVFAALNQTADGGKTPEPVLRAPTAEQERELASLRARIAELEGALSAEDPKLDAEQRVWEERAAIELEREGSWSVLRPLTAVEASAARVDGTLLEDGSVAFRGPVPDRCVYELRLDAPVGELRLLKLEALLDGEPLAGPGRTSHGNFVLSEISARIEDASDPRQGENVALTAAIGEVEQSDGPFRAANSIDGRSETGWAIGGGVGSPRTAVFALERPVRVAKTQVVRVHLAFESVFLRHALARVRISASNDERAARRLLGPSGVGWKRLGPFAAASFEEARDRAYAPEQDLAAALSARASDEGLQWSAADVKRATLEGDRSAWYFARELDCERDGQLEFFVGADDFVRVWLDGSVIHESADYGTFVGTPARIQVRLAQGRHQLLAKVVNGAGPGGFSFDIGHDTADRITPEIEALLKLEPEARSAEQARTLRDWYRRGPSELGSALADELTKLRKRRDEIEAMLPSVMVMEAVATPRQSRVFVRGSFLTPGEPVEAGLPSLFGALAKDEPPRLALARWLVSPANPLAARAHVNRTWELLFGRGLVATVQDFGMRGDAPSHPELLDWLAVEFIESGWDMKALVETIVTSAAYRRSSDVPRAEHERDRHNVALARGARFRMEAEMLRDNALAIAGLLVESHGGASVFPPQPAGTWNSAYSGDDWRESAGRDRHRRGLYTFAKRTAPYVTFQLFDAPSREVSCTRRERTNTPLQALALLDDPVFVECALALARRIVRERAGSDAERLAWAFRVSTARDPRPRELGRLLELLGSARSDFADESVARARVRLLELDPPDARELATWTSVATVLLNLDDTVVRN